MLEALQGKDWITVFVGTLVAVLYLSTFNYYLTLSRKRRRIRRLKLHSAISLGLKTGTLVSVEDFVNIYKGVHGLGSDDASYRSGLAKALREYVVDVVSNDQLERLESKKLKDAATSVLRRIEAESPFADLPAAERNLLLDVNRFVRANDLEAALRKVEDLAGLIEIRQDTLEQIQRKNKWSVPLAAVGLVLTVIFGIVSVFK